MIGKTVSHYRIVEELGRGGMGVVYRAQDTTLNRDVALKFLNVRPDAGAEGEERLFREARAAAGLDHPNICTVYEVGESDGQFFIAMACIEGRPLTERIAAGALDIEEAVDLAIQVARGLAEAHSKRLAHRDIKPANILVSSTGHVRITDFGIADSFENTSDDIDTTSGTTAYMSPEQLRGEQAGAQTDVWSLGVVLYEMLTGARPFRGDYDQAVVYGILNLEPEPLTRARAEVVDALADVVGRALRKDPHDRYADASEMLKALESISTTPPPTVEEQRTVVVTTFENLTGDSSCGYLSKALPNLLITSLEQSSRLRVVTWERMHDLAHQLGHENVTEFPAALGAEICKMEGVETIIVGSFTKAGDVFVTDARALDAETKNLLVSATSRGRGIDSILDLQVDELSSELLLGLGLADEEMPEEHPPISEATTSSMEAYRLFLRGRDAADRLYNQDARELLVRATEEDPEFASAYLYLGQVLNRLREISAGREAIEKAKQCSEHASRRERLSIDAAYARYVKHDPDDEYRALIRMAREFPDEKRVHYRLAGYYRAKKRFYLAVEEYKRVIELDPSYGWAINQLGYMYADVEDFEKAAEYFDRYASVSPGDANPIDSMGELCFRMGRLTEARERYEEALRLKPDFYYACWELAYVSALRESYDDALTWIDRYMELAPSFGTRLEGKRWKSFYLCWIGRSDEAAALAREMADEADAEGSALWTVEARRMLGWIHLSRDEVPVARIEFAACVEAIDHDPAAFIPAASSYSQASLEQVPAQRAAHVFALAMADVAAGDTDAAWVGYDAVRQLLPEHASLLRAEILLAEGDSRDALTAAREMPQWTIPYMSDPEGLVLYNLPPLKDVRARALVANGELFRAIEEYEQLLIVDHTTKDRFLVHPLYHLRLAELFEAKGWQAKARSQYERFLSICTASECHHAETARHRLEVLTKL